MCFHRSKPHVFNPYTILPLLDEEAFYSIFFSLVLIEFQYDPIPCSSVGKEFTCNVGDMGSIPGSERARSPGEGIAIHSSIL